MSGPAPEEIDAGADTPRRLCVYTGGFLLNRGLRRSLALAGWQVALCKPRPGDTIGIWGASPRAWRGERVAEATGAPILRIEDAWLRSLFPGRAGERPFGLLFDHTGLHFDAARPSDLETLLATHPLDDTALLDRARGAIDWLRRSHLTKYAATDPEAELPAPGYVLVIDQVAGDASVTASGGDANRFREMLFAARDEHPGARIVVKTHPETAQGFRPGHLKPADLMGCEICDTSVSPWALLEGAVAVYTLSSQMGLEALLAGHRPRVFGTPFYAGWGLTEDETTLPRRGRALTRAQLVAAAYLIYPTWIDPARDRVCSFEEAAAQLDAETRAWREDRKGWTASGMRLWKRPALQRVFGRHAPVRFTDSPRPGTPHMAWAASAPPEARLHRLEDGFLRSRGLGAELVPPLSLALDPDGIYYDPAHPSRLEQLIAASPKLAPDQIDRATKLIAFLTRAKLTKYNLPGSLPDLPERGTAPRILVPGQVEDDASIRLGTGETRTNEALLARTRAENPDALILWKPHPDVVAGLRPGAVESPERYADLTVTGDIAMLMDHVDQVWTLTSLAGFEALLRGIPVTTLGAPFYAGWDLTRDLGTVPERRRRGPRPSLEGLVHATLIDYPRYVDPVSGRPCPVETVAQRLTRDEIPAPGPFNRSLSKLQGLFATRAHLWRR
ncbi:capsular polysaccharide biosynthesis protein [Litorisediminicola beolgyonensis]|uniref:Capsular polysaccharide biosynthesis protein n=1 Tax=Litorisediminicola beolgyonensis TaxID=1173614 RepID=A0ABW3ZM91_9RHOB